MPFKRWGMALAAKCWASGSSQSVTASPPTVCLSSNLCTLWALQWGAVGNCLMHSDAALPLKLLFVWRIKKVWDWKIYLSAQKASFEKQSSPVPEKWAHADFPFTPTKRVKGQVGLGSLWESCFKTDSLLPEPTFSHSILHGQHLLFSCFCPIAFPRSLQTARRDGYPNKWHAKSLSHSRWPELCLCC